MRASDPYGDVAASPIRMFRAARIATPGPGAGDTLATLGDRVLELGDFAALRDRFPSAEVVDLPGALVVPGFNDAHCHPSITSQTRLRVDVSPTAVGDVADVRARLRERARATPAGDWIVAAGYVPGGRSRVERALLDDVSTDHPVIVVLAHLHFSVANSRALTMLGFDDDSGDPVGGRLGRDTAGRLDGWLYEQAFFEPYFGGAGQPPRVAEPDTDAAVDALVAENQRLHSVGLTSYCDAIVTPRSWHVYDAARARGRLTPRVGMLLWSRYLDAVRELGLTAGFGDQFLRFVGVKMMYDGALSGATCLCSEPYASATGTGNGVGLVDPEEFPALVRAVHSSGGRVCVHANGDAAIAATLDAIEAAQNASPGVVRHRVEHCSMTDGPTIGRLAALGVIAVPFGQFIHHHGERLVEFYGPERAGALLAHRSLLDGGVTVAGSSDHPAGPMAPLLAIQSLATRTTSTGRVLGGDERISVAAALAVYTVGSAHATGESELKGRLAPGQLADFTVLDRDILAVDPATIADTVVLSTWVGASCVYSAN